MKKIKAVEIVKYWDKDKQKNLKAINLVGEDFGTILYHDLDFKDNRQLMTYVTSLELEKIDIAYHQSSKEYHRRNLQAFYEVESQLRKDKAIIYFLLK